jgi:hypothetical protein
MRGGEFTEFVVRRVTNWPGVETTTHPDGDVELRVGTGLLGYAHETGVVELAFSSAVRDQLLTEGRADRHHTDPRSSWVSLRVRTAEDIRDVLWLLRFAYLCCLQRLTESEDGVTTQRLDLDEEFDRLGVSVSLRVLARQPPTTSEPPTQTA